MYLLQLAVQNSYSLYRAYTTDEKRMSLLQYQDMVAHALMNFDPTQWTASGPPLPRAESLPPSERLDRLPPTPRGLGRTPPSASASSASATPRPPATQEEEEQVDDPGIPAAPTPATATATATATPSAATHAPARAVQERPAPGPSRIYVDPECRLDRGGDHDIVPLQGKTRQRRCRVCHMNGKRKDTTRQCQRCQIPLCKAPCFALYHTKRVYWNAPPSGTSEGVHSRSQARR